MSSFVDTNIPIYASGGEHPFKANCIEILRLVVDFPTAFVTDAEVLQEILHRYKAIRRLAAGMRTLIDFAQIMQGQIEPMNARDVLVAAELAIRHPSLEARDLVHVAVMQRLGVTRIVSSDRGFDALPDIERLDPARLEEWRATILDGAG